MVKEGLRSNLTEAYFGLAENALKIKHNSEYRIHRIVFTNKQMRTKIMITSEVFQKLKKLTNWKDSNSINFFKNEVFSLGLTKYGNIILYCKVKPELFAKEFIRSMNEDFCLTPKEISYLAKYLDPSSVEIAHDITDPLAKLKNSKILMKYKDTVKELWQILAYTDNSNGTLEIEFKGDPQESSNLEFLLRDKIGAVKYFYQLTKTLEELIKYNARLESKVDIITTANLVLLEALLEYEETTEQITELDTFSTEQKKKTR